MTGASSRSVERCFEEAEETGTLLVCGKSLKEFPSTVDNYDLTDVIRADLSRNRFADLPAEVSSFFMLEELNLSHNSLKTIPDLSQLQCLATLRLSHNQLVTLPVHVCSLPLRILQVSHNKLSAVPTEIGLLTQLQDLDFSCNDLTTLPSSIGELSSLRNLSIRKNSLHSIPDELSKLKSLITLDFSCNKISVIPPAFRLITSLVELDLKNNPLTSPPAQICLKGRVHIFKYLSLAAQQQEKRWSIDRERKYRRSPSSSSISSNSLQEDAKLNHIDERRELSTGIDLVDARTIKNAFPEKDRESFLYDHLDKFDRHSIPETYSSERDGSRQRGGSSGTVSLPGRASEAIDQDLNQTDTRDQTPPLTLETVKDTGPSPEKTRTLPRKGSRSSEGSGAHRTKSEKGAAPPPPKVRQRGAGSFTVAGDKPKGTAQMSMSLDRKQIRNYGQKMKSYSATDEQTNGNKGSADDLMARKQQLLQSRKEALRSKQKLEQFKTKTAKKDAATPTPKERPTKDETPKSPASSATQSSQDSLSSHSTTESPEDAAPFEGIAKRTSMGQGRTVRALKDGASTYTLRRMYDSARVEFQQLEMLREALESRLKITLPDDLPAALADGVVLCHLVNHLRKSTIPVIHVPSSGVVMNCLGCKERHIPDDFDGVNGVGLSIINIYKPKLTMPKCQMNVDAFLEGSRKLGVEKANLCAPSDILEEKSPNKVCLTVQALLEAMGSGAS